VESPRPILRVGLTGGIASGKTTIGRIFVSLGAYVIEADALVHELLQPRTNVFHAVIAQFGDACLAPDGTIDRASLGQRVFHDAAARVALEAIVHPAVRAEAERRLQAYGPAGRSPVAIFDAALLVETGTHRDFRRLVVARCSRAAQLHRLLARNRFTADEAEARLDAQAPLADKLAVADYVIDTEGTLRETERQTEHVWAALLSDFDAEFGAVPGRS
jgi:dephospho-CoA kinase